MEGYDYYETLNCSNTTLCCHLTHKEGEVNCDGTIYSTEVYYRPPDVRFYVYMAAYAAATLFAGMMSGLTIGLLSLDITSLEVLAKGGHPSEKRYAAHIVRIVKRHHWLLVTLLLSNACAVETMPIFLNQLTNEYISIIISITLVLLFGEIIPQAVCSRYGLSIGYYLSPLIIVLMIVSFPISYPIAKFLDCVIGSHGTGMYYRRAELGELVKLHGRLSDENEEPLTISEIRIVKGALSLQRKKVKDVLTPIDSVFMLDIDRTLDQETVNEIYDEGYSRVPIFEGERSNIVGLLLVKTLIRLDVCHQHTIRSISSSLLSPRYCLKLTPLYTALNQFFIIKTHLFFVHDTYPNRGKLIGIITMEDILEQVLDEQIVDETDRFVNVARRIPVMHRQREYRHRTHSLMTSVIKEEEDSTLLYPTNVKFQRGTVSMPTGELGDGGTTIQADETTPLIQD